MEKRINYDGAVTHELENFKRWFKNNRQKSINLNYKKVKLLMDKQISEGRLFPTVEKSETNNIFFEKIYFRDIFYNLKFNHLKYFELPSEISDYLWLKDLVDLEKPKRKITEAFESEDRKQHNYMLELYSQKVHKIKNALIKDAAVISAFSHDIKIDNDKDVLLKDNIKVVVSKLGRDAIKKYEHLNDDQIDNIIGCIHPICTYTGVDSEIINLLRHLAPLIIFILVNLPKNELFDAEDNNNTGKKILNIILTACQDILTLKSLDKLNKSQMDIKDIQRLFLLAAYDSKENIFKRALTGRFKSETGYRKKYNTSTSQLITIPYEKENKSHKKRYDRTEVIEGDYHNLTWLFFLLSEKNCKLPLAGFITLLNSCEIEINESPFHFNKTINLIVFNSLTRFIDAYFEADQGCSSLIYGLNGLHTKKTSLESRLTMEDVDILNMIMWSIENNISCKLDPVKLKINLDPFEYYKNIIFTTKIEPMPKIKDDGSYECIYEGEINASYKNKL